MGQKMLPPLHQEVKRTLFEEIDNMVWNCRRKEIARWRKTNKVYDEITEAEMEDTWNREVSDDNEAIRLNGKYVWQTAKRVCDFINTHDDLIKIASLGGYRTVMKKLMKVIREAHNAERKGRQTGRKNKRDEERMKT